MMRPEMVARFEDDRLVYEAYGYWRLLPSIPFDESYIRELAAGGTPTDFTCFRAILKLLTTAGNFKHAAELAEIGMEAFQPIVDDDALLELSVTRAELEVHQNNYERAIELGLRFIREHTFENREETILRIRANALLSVCYYHLGKLDEAEEVTRQSIGLVGAVFGARSYDSAIVLKNLGALLIGRGQYSNAAIYCEQAVGLFTRLLGRTNPDTVLCRINLGLAKAYQSLFEDALAEVRAAHLILSTSLGPTHTQTLSAYRQVAEILARSGNSKDARFIANEVREKLVASFDTRSTSVPSCAIFIGYTYYLERDYSSALPYYEENIPILATLLGENHPDILRYKSRREEILKTLRGPQPSGSA
jgi:tetratricopeptide (TPR) repeat protein